MVTTIKFDDNEKEKANICVNIDRILRVLDTVYDYAYMKDDEELKKIIDDYLNLKEN